MIESILPFIKLSPAVKNALHHKLPVVALESTVISHGLPYPDNRDVTLHMMNAITESGAVPAVIALIDGCIHIGLTDDELEMFAICSDVLKISRPDIAYCLATKQLGATTVSATMICAAYAGIRVFSTGGLGGVHRGAETTFDISADLTEFSKTPILVVCSGVKSILDVPKTLEYLETQGVPIIGYQTDRFPLFFTHSSNHGLTQSLNNSYDIARTAEIHWELGLSGMVVANPVPEYASIQDDIVERWVNEAVDQLNENNIRGKAVTPFILSKVSALSEGKTLHANKALLISNARLAGQISASLSALSLSDTSSVSEFNAKEFSRERRKG
jgi:pseudouridine-5'-phosphate glycosidase